MEVEWGRVARESVLRGRIAHVEQVLPLLVLRLLCAVGLFLVKQLPVSRRIVLARILGMCTLHGERHTSRSDQQSEG